MKKAILLTTLIFSALFISCGSDDDGGDNDAIVGKWQLEQTFTNEVSNDISDCEKQQTTEFLASSDFMSVNFEEKMENDEIVCKRIEDNSGTWKNLEDGNYEFTLIIDGSDRTVVFETKIDGDTLSLSATDNVNGQEIILKRVFKKI